MAVHLRIYRDLGRRTLRALEHHAAYPDIDWIAVSRGMGVPAEAVDTAEKLAEALIRALAEPGPNLIQMNL